STPDGAPADGPDAPADATPAPSFTPSPSATPPSPTAPSTPMTPAAAGLAGSAVPEGMVSKRSKKPLIMGVIIAVVVVLLGGSAAAFYMIMNKPQNVLNMALLNTMSVDKVKSVNFDGSLDIKPKDGPNIGTTFTGSGNSDGAFSVSAKVDALVTTVNADVRSTDGKTFYLRVGGLDGLSSLLGTSASSYGPIIASLNNQWIQINQSMIEQLTGSSTSLDTKLTAADRQKLEDAYKKNQFLVVSKALKDETIKDQKSHHYQITVDKDKFKAFLTAVKDANISSLKIDANSLKSATDSVNKIDFNKYPVDIWIAKGSKLIDQVSFSTTSSDTTATVRLTIDDVNKAVNVVAPSGAKSLLEILSNLLGGAGGTTNLGGISL
ncbi:MAG TPA: hypothetical protein VF466_04450, partial [Candidatus Saccharimonadales bacterium]